MRPLASSREQRVSPEFRFIRTCQRYNSSVAGSAPKQAYSREETRRLLDISERQLKSWEKQGLVSASQAYGFHELVALRTLIKLRENRVPPARIKLAVNALSQTLRDVHDPLKQLKLYADGKKIRVDVEGRKMEAVSGQLLLDFGQAELKRLVEFRAKEDIQNERTQRLEAERWFQRGLELEQTGAPIEQVVGAYEKAVKLDPKSAGALVNLGTICFNTQKWREAEKYYREALIADPGYALAHFNLANLYDERGQRDQALGHYLEALKIAPSYADAHYNVALLYQATNQPMKAVHHWTKYLKLDPGSNWANIARRELAKLKQNTLVPGPRN
jgi:tetratricopeptide (TPR) repeat protein